MSADIYSGTSDYLASYLTLQAASFPGGIYLAQIPEDHAGLYPCLVIEDLGFDTDWTFEKGFKDTGALKIDVYAVTAAATRILGDQVKAAFADPATWQAIVIANATVLSFLRRRFQIISEQYRGPDQQLLFKHESEYDVEVMGTY